MLFLGGWVNMKLPKSPSRPFKISENAIINSLDDLIGFFNHYSVLLLLHDPDNRQKNRKQGGHFSK